MTTTAPPLATPDVDVATDFLTWADFATPPPCDRAWPAIRTVLVDVHAHAAFVLLTACPTCGTVRTWHICEPCRDALYAHDCYRCGAGHVGPFRRFVQRVERIGGAR